MPRLNPDQRHRAQRFAPSKGDHLPALRLRLYLLCGSTLRSYLGGFSLDLWCQNQVDHPLGHGARTPFSISSEEGRSIGL